MSERTIGADEAGRGPLAGPVVAAAVILSDAQRDELLKKGLADSKRVSAPRREALFRLMNDLGVRWAAQAASPERIDSMNILRASLWAMGQSVRKIARDGDCVLVDGPYEIPGLSLEQQAIPHGDALVPDISAASIVAKVLRDRVMARLDRIFPGYGLAGHKGYPTAAHYDAIARLGPSAIHRRSFRLFRP